MSADVTIKDEELSILTDEQVAEVLEAFADGMQEGSAPVEATLDEHIAMLSIVRTLRHAAQRLRKSVTTANPS